MTDHGCHVYGESGRGLAILFSVLTGVFLALEVRHCHCAIPRAMELQFKGTLAFFGSREAAHMDIPWLEESSFRDALVSGEKFFLRQILFSQIAREMPPPGAEVVARSPVANVRGAIPITWDIGITVARFVGRACAIIGASALVLNSPERWPLIRRQESPVAQAARRPERERGKPFYEIGDLRSALGNFTVCGYLRHRRANVTSRGIDLLSIRY